MRQDQLKKGDVEILKIYGELFKTSSSCSTIFHIYLRFLSCSKFQSMNLLPLSFSCKLVFICILLLNSLSINIREKFINPVLSMETSKTKS